MDLDKTKILRILAISSFFLFLMLSLQWYFGKNVKLRALERELLEHKYVSSVEINEQKEQVVVCLSLMNIDNFKEAYDKICETIKERLKMQPFELKIINEADPELEDIFDNKVQFIVYEALATGEFTKMRASLDEIENTSDSLRVQVFLDSSKLFLHIRLKESNYYRIINREV